MECRAGCGACCIALSISSPIPGMPGGKPAGVRCVQLTDDNRCRLFGLPERPEVCVRLTPDEEMCGETAEHALAYLAFLERATAPETPDAARIPSFSSLKSLASLPSLAPGPKTAPAGAGREGQGGPSAA